MIESLVANGASLETKTAFSQEKYMKKKEKKYTPRVFLRRPSAGSICEAYFVKDPLKICAVRAPLEKLVAARPVALSFKEETPAVLKGAEVQNGGIVPVGKDQVLPGVLEGQNVAQVQNGLEEGEVRVPPQEVAKTMAGESVPMENSKSHSMDVDHEEKSNATAVEGREEDGCEPLDKELNAAEVKERKGIKVPRPGNEASSSDIHRWASQGFSR
ncbi:hypothetical protein R1sor_011720 [Riccia sorocarpa]|uniref:tRNA (adenine(58)-N(1))-methyltransferase non-catalytic subunit TRM6 n=1 Tax=Riccia sorocarpa TaxID=122646 RepID=A0ABD3I3K7_9MARC